MNLGLRCRSIGTAVGIVTDHIGLRSSLGVSAKATGRYNLPVQCRACKGVILIAYRTDCRIAIRAMRIFFVLTCGILLVTVGSIMTCVFCGGIVAIGAFLHPLVLTCAVIPPRAVAERTVRGAGGNRHAAVFTNGLPLTAGCPFLLGRGVGAFPKSIQRHACICGVFPAGLILRTGHEFIRCPTLEGITRAAGRYRRQRQRDIFGFGLTARRTASAVCVIRNGVGCRSVFLPYGVKGKIGICITPFARLIRCTCR